MNSSLRKFNPGLNQDDKSVIDQFVVRLPLLKALLEMINDNSNRPICQHVLYFGPRGRGKTMLMARMAAELRTNKNLKKIWVPIRLIEESYYEIEDTAGFWIEVLSTLIHQLPSEHKANSKILLKSLTDNWNHPHLEEMGRASVLDILEKINKKAVIIIENLHQLLEDNDTDFGWYIRKIMQNEPNIMIVATATTRFEQLDNAKEPLYDIFATNELRALNRKDVAILWNKLTSDNKTEKQIAPISILTGGSPRLITIIADFAKHNKVSELLENLTVLIDEHTEYFRGQLESLAPKERKVFTALADLWKESTSSEIAKRARIGIRTASSLLSRLVHKGAVTVNSASPRKKYYIVSERMFCIYYKLRRQHSYQSLLDALVQFMLDFYSPDELEQITSQYKSKRNISIEENFVIQKLKDETTTDDENNLSNITYKKVLDEFSKIVEKYGNTNVAKAIASLKKIIEENNSSKDTSILYLVSLAMITLGGMHSQTNNFKEEIDVYNNIIKQFKQHKNIKILLNIAQAMFNLGIAHNDNKNIPQSISSYKKLIKKFNSAKDLEILFYVIMSMYNLAILYENNGESKKQIDILNSLILKFKSNKKTNFMIAVAKAMYRIAYYYWKLNKKNQSIEHYTQIIEKYKHNNNSDLLQMVAISYINKSNILLITQQISKAKRTYKEAYEYFLEKDFENNNILISTSLLGIQLSKNITHLHSQLKTSVYKLVKIANEKNVNDERMFLALGIAALFPANIALTMIQEGQDSQTLQPLVVALKQMNGEEVRTSMETLEIAEDVKQRIKQMKIDLVS